MCRPADLLNPFKNLFAFPFVYQHPEGLPAVRGLDDRNRQIATHVCLRLWFLRCLQDLEHLLGVRGRLEAREKQLYVGFIGEEHPARVLILQSGFEGMEAGSLSLERIRHELVLVLVIIGHQGNSVGKSLRFPFFPQCAITNRNTKGVLRVLLGRY